MKLKLDFIACLFILGCLTSSCNYISTEEPILNVVYDFIDAVEENQNEKAVSLLSEETRSRVGSQIVQPNSQLTDVVNIFRRRSVSERSNQNGIFTRNERKEIAVQLDKNDKQSTYIFVVKKDQQGKWEIVNVLKE